MANGSTIRTQPLLMLRVPDSNAPSGQIRVSVLEKGIDLSGRSNIVVEGIHVRHTSLGLDLSKVQNIESTFYQVF